MGTLSGMDFGVSLFLIAVGAILDFAVNASVNGVNIHTVGVILMIAGGIGILLSLLVLGTGRGWRSGPRGYYRQDLP